MVKWPRLLAILATLGAVGLFGLALAVAVFVSMDEVSGVHLPQLYWVAAALALTGGLVGWGAARLWDRNDREEP